LIVRQTKEGLLRRHFAIALVAALGTSAFAGPAFSADTQQQSNMKSCAAQWSGMAAADKSKTTYKAYMSTCMKAPASTAAAAPAPAMTAKPVAAPAAMKAQSGSAKCKDGKTVTYTHRSGTCSGHGGVASWM
jgi:hypothetical protein